AFNKSFGSDRSLHRPLSAIANQRCSPNKPFGSDRSLHRPLSAIANQRCSPNKPFESDRSLHSAFSAIANQRRLPEDVEFLESVSSRDAHIVEEGVGTHLSTSAMAASAMNLSMGNSYD